MNSTQRTNAAETIQVKLVKGTRTHVFRFGRDDRAAAQQAVAEMACEPRSGIDWFDAACVIERMHAAAAAAR